MGYPEGTVDAQQRPSGDRPTYDLSTREGLPLGEARVFNIGEDELFQTLSAFARMGQQDVAGTETARLLAAARTNEEAVLIVEHPPGDRLSVLLEDLEMGDASIVAAARALAKLHGSVNRSLSASALAHGSEVLLQRPSSPLELRRNRRE